jgi:hypothetical protein
LNLGDLDMRSLRSIFLGTAALLASFALAACGGGGGGGGTVGTASLRGTVVSVDGTTSNLGGVVLVDPRTGKTVVTAGNGAFDFGRVPAGTITLRVGGGATAMVTVAREETGGGESGDEPGDGVGGDEPSGDDDGADHEAGEHEGDHEAGDDDGRHDGRDDGDDHDVGDDDCDVANVSDGENVDVNVSIRDGKIDSVEVSCSRGDERRAQVALERAAESDDADANGALRIALNDERSFVRLAGEHLTPGRSVEWFVLDLDGVAESQGTRTVDADGKAVWELSTKDGDALPFGVATVADLEGFQVEIRDATDGSVLLFATVPALPVSAPPESHEGPGHDGSDDGTRARGRALLAATAGGEAHVAVESRTGEEAREKIEIEAVALDVGTTLDVFLENPATPGTLEKIGTITIGELGRGELERDTHDGDGLPFGAANVAALAGLAVELRATDGTVLFSGHVPAAVVEND